jgi:hypothetical protein
MRDWRATQHQSRSPSRRKGTASCYPATQQSLSSSAHSQEWSASCARAVLLFKTDPLHSRTRQHAFQRERHGAREGLHSWEHAETMRDWRATQHQSRSPSRRKGTASCYPATQQSLSSSAHSQEWSASCARAVLLFKTDPLHSRTRQHAFQRERHGAREGLHS